MCHIHKPLPSLPHAGPFTGPGEAARNQELKGVGEGAVSAVFFGKPPNGPSLSNQEARTLPLPRQKNHVCLHAIFTTNGFDNCYRSSKAKDLLNSPREVELGGGADSKGGVEKKQKANSLGNAHESRRCDAQSCSRRYGGAGAERASLGGRAGGDCFCFQ